jgi:hypothetical protein
VDGWGQKVIPRPSADSFAVGRRQKSTSFAAWHLNNSVFPFQLSTRASNNVEKKKRLVKAFKKGVSADGQRLFQVISKT